MYVSAAEEVEANHTHLVMTTPIQYELPGLPSVFRFP